MPSSDSLAACTPATMCDDLPGAQDLQLTQAHFCRKQAAEYRHEEAKRLKNIAWLQGLFGLTLFAGPVFVGIASFAAYVLAGNELTAAKAYTALAFFTLLRFPMGAP